jgi:8-oxo-dGTP pyrophosphatase MutT (NUDIX family)
MKKMFKLISLSVVFCVGYAFYKSSKKKKKGQTDPETGISTPKDTVKKPENRAIQQIKVSNDCKTLGSPHGPEIQETNLKKIYGEFEFRVTVSRQTEKFQGENEERSLFKNLNGAGVCLFDSELKKILLVKDSRSKKWSFPKGRFELEETIFQTAVRETFEETKLAYLTDYTAISDSIYVCDRYYIIFAKVNKDYNKELRADISWNVEEIKWFSKSELLELKNRDKNRPTSYLINKLQNYMD